RSDRTYLITGGLGALGLAIAEFLAARGAHRLCLVGRRGVATASAHAAIERLERRGVGVDVRAADVSRFDEIAAVVDAIGASAHPLGGVVHAAGVTGFGMLGEVSPTEAAAILRPKVAGAWFLHQLTADADLQVFLCCSSMVSVWGARGQGPYAAANHFLDALAHLRRTRGLVATTVNWGPLTGGGMVPADVIRELRAMGVSSTPLDVAVETLDEVLTAGAAQPIVVDIDWPVFRELYRTRSRSAIFDLVIGDGAAPAVSVGPSSSRRDDVLSAPSGERRDVVIEVLRELLARVVRDVERIDTATGLFQMGLDSLGAMEFRRLIEQSLAVSIPATLLFDRGTLGELADAVLALLVPEAAAVAAPLPALDDLNEAELETLLRRKLDEVG
ncbi:MAG TPA: beta-ketoacyl reductase, partial [Vicinamibacterales bacterium]|nr:beta-ketoacyl reductase [Vicinamibacterales bacterium]